MNKLILRYGYCLESQKEAVFEQLRQMPSMLNVKSIAGIAEFSVFAALVNTQSAFDVTAHGAHFVQAPIPNKRSHQTKPKQNGRKKQVSDTSTPTSTHEQVSHLRGISRFKFQALGLSDDEIRTCKRANRSFRRQKNKVLTPKNWRQHINRKAAVLEVELLLKRAQSRGEPCWIKNPQYTPVSLARVFTPRKKTNTRQVSIGMTTKHAQIVAHSSGHTAYEKENSQAGRS